MTRWAQVCRSPAVVGAKTKGIIHPDSASRRTRSRRRASEPGLGSCPRAFATRQSHFARHSAPRSSLAALAIRSIQLNPSPSRHQRCSSATRRDRTSNSNSSCLARTRARGAARPTGDKGGTAALRTTRAARGVHASLRRRAIGAARGAARRPRARAQRIERVRRPCILLAAQNPSHRRRRPRGGRRRRWTGPGGERGGAGARVAASTAARPTARCARAADPSRERRRRGRHPAERRRLRLARVLEGAPAPSRLARRRPRDPSPSGDASRVSAMQANFVRFSSRTRSARGLRRRSTSSHAAMPPARRRSASPARGASPPPARSKSPARHPAIAAKPTRAPPPPPRRRLLPLLGGAPRWRSAWRCSRRARARRCGATRAESTSGRFSRGTASRSSGCPT